MILRKSMLYQESVSLVDLPNNFSSVGSNSSELDLQGNQGPCGTNCFSLALHQANRSRCYYSDRHPKTISMAKYALPIFYYNHL